MNLIPCPDGSLADPTVGCAGVPATVINPESGVLALLLKGTEFLMIAAAAVATGFLIYGAILYAMAGGDELKIEQAKSVIFWSIGGLALGLLSGALAKLLLDIIS